MDDCEKKIASDCECDGLVHSAPEGLYRQNRGPVPDPLHVGAPGKRPRALSWLWWVSALSCSLGVVAGVCFVVSLVCMVQRADVCVYRQAKCRDKTVGVKDLCLFAVCFLLFGGGSRSGGSLGVLGAAVPQIASPTVRGGSWAPPPRFAFL